VLTSFRTALICLLLFYILTENINLNSIRLPAGEFLRDFVAFFCSVCERGGVMHFVCLFFSLAQMTWIIFAEALGSYWVLWGICHLFIVLSVGQFDGCSKTSDSSFLVFFLQSKWIGRGNKGWTLEHKVVKTWLQRKAMFTLDIQMWPIS